MDIQNEMPLGLGMALAQNTEALARFSGLPEEQRSALIRKAGAVRSRDEMNALIRDLL